MKSPTDLAVEIEGEVLDKITILLDVTKNRPGLTARNIASKLDLSIGRVLEVLHKSECVLRQRKHNSWLWWNDWSQCEPGFIPKRKRGPKPGATKKPKEPKPIWVL